MLADSHWFIPPDSAEDQHQEGDFSVCQRVLHRGFYKLMLAPPPTASNERERPRSTVLCDVAGYVGFSAADSGLCNGRKSKARVNVRTKVCICILQWQHRGLKHNTNGIITCLAGSKVLRERIHCSALA